MALSLSWSAAPVGAPLVTTPAGAVLPPPLVTFITLDDRSPSRSGHNIPLPPDEGSPAEVAPATKAWDDAVNPGKARENGMCGKGPRRGLQPRTGGRRPSAAVAVLLAVGVVAAPAHAEGLWDTLLEKMNVKATPAGPGPDFVERTRPDPAGLGYLPTALPHKVSPLAVKGAAEIQAKKDALDAAKTKQLNPSAPAPLQVVKTAGAAKPASRKPLEPKPAPVSD